MSHNFPCSTQGGKLSGISKTILGGREFGARGGGGGTMLPVPVARALSL